jgi:hypothetical protein
VIDIEAEFAAVDRRVRASINRNVRDALARIDAATGGELREGTRKPPIVEAGEALGEFVRHYVETLQTFAAAFRRGLGGGVS